MKNADHDRDMERRRELSENGFGVLPENMNDLPDKSKPNTPPLQTYSFSNEMIIQAESEEHAKQIFASNSHNFAADAECEVYTTNRINSKKEGV